MRATLNQIVSRLPVDDTDNAKMIIANFLESVGDELANGNTVNIHGFGTFFTKDVKPGVAFKVEHGSSKSVKFRVGSTLKAKVN